jgi:hypothetical protein
LAYLHCPAYVEWLELQEERERGERTASLRRRPLPTSASMMQVFLGSVRASLRLAAMGA